ncbi:DAK2 domain-containing protein [Paradesulfitobacterium ferrireducens]|uniref:DAK2 domain-containing protein n=1 Tax=Paradesulfitobacterium ferrireducens TaxID=2816476 RepID=UPI001A8DE13C|nr:DAK2 domain-containing protein [Paradesulfitobacterium ferrireducens]
MIAGGARALEQKKQEVDALNVFPVPDGDTGTNMFLTIQSAARDAERTSGESVSEVAAAVSMGSLMGARGNSGVILSQLLRGIAKGVEGLKTVNAAQLAHALQTGVDTAYKAVMRPVEGTILTVSRETARAALSKAKQGGSPLETLMEGYRKGQEALARTPELLPALKQAGVVDAGGQGFLIILGGWIAVLEGKALQPESFTAAQPVQEPVAQGIARVENLEFPYCTEFLVKGSALNPEQIRQDLKDWGDSLLVVGTPEVVKIHNMLAQNEAAAHAQKEPPAPVESAPGVPDKENGLVAVTMGEGISEIFKSLGVDELVVGGQTMNPSTEDLAEAVRKVRAKNIYILPNNSNIMLAARQVQEVVPERSVSVIPSKSIPQGIAALMNFNPEGEAENNLMAMETGLASVKSGEVTYAVRDSQWDDLEIKAGDVLGLVEDKIVATGTSLMAVAQATLEKMEWRTRDLVTIFYGQEVEPQEVQRLQDWLGRENSGVEVETHPGGQPLYYYIFGVE